MTSPVPDVPADTTPAPASTALPEQHARIVVGVDCSTGSRDVLRQAAKVAADLDAGLDAVFVYLAPTHHGRVLPGAVPEKELHGHMHNLLRDVVRDTFGTHHPPHLALYALDGDAARVLLTRAKDAALLVVGSSGHGGVTNLLLGSVAAKCVEHAPGPVLIVHPGKRREPQLATTTAGDADHDHAVMASAGRIVVGVDGSSASKEALRWAARLGAATETGIDTLITWDPAIYFGGFGASYIPSGWDPEADLSASLAECVDEVLGEERTADLRQFAEEGPAARQLLGHAHDAALLVVGNRGHGGFASLLLGSVSARCANFASCPVLVVHAPDRTAASEQPRDDHSAPVDPRPVTA